MQQKLSIQIVEHAASVKPEASVELAASVKPEASVERAECSACSEC